MGKDETVVVAPDPQSQRDREKITFDSLRLAIGDTQTMIRGYDTKAQVLIAVLTFAVGSLGRAIEDEHLALWIIAIVVAAVTAAFVCCACVLYPRAPGVKARTADDLAPSNTYFLAGPMITMKLRDLVGRVRQTDWLSELVFELQKLASVRQRKAYWFKWAFISTGVAVMGLYLILLVF